MPDSTSPVAWIDVETTGVNVSSCDLLEIAAVVTTGPDYTPVDDGIVVTIHPQQFASLSPAAAVEGTKSALLKRAEGDGYEARGARRVYDMHVSSGLFADIEAEQCVALADADHMVWEYLAKHVKPRGAILGGNSITLDRNFLEAYAPKTFNHIHYRSLDCTSVYELVRRLPGVGEDSALTVEQEGVSHRAMSDIFTSIKQARVLGKFLSGAVPVTG